MNPPADLTGASSPAQRKNSGAKRNGAPPAAKTPAGSDGHRSLPQSVEAEKALLSSALLSPREVLTECAEKIGEDAFYSPAHADIFRVMLEMWTANQLIDVITLTNRLRDLSLLDAVGGPGVVTELLGFVPTAANARHYLEIVSEKSLLRRMITTCTAAASRCYEEQADVRQLLDDVERDVLAVGNTRFKDVAAGLREEVFEALKNIEKMFQQRGGISGLPTGFTYFDRMTDGMHPGEMIIVAARPSMGKTALAMNIVEHVALDLPEPKPVGVFSLEMSTQQLVQRMLCSRARVNMKTVRSGMLPRSEHGKLNDAAAALTEAAIFIDDTPSLSILELRAKARRMRDRHGIELIAIDYLQLCRSTTRRGQENRQIEISEISSGIKALAKELKIPIIVLAQLNRQPEARGGGKPRMSDLRESGSLEQDADVVALLVRPEVYEDDAETKAELSGKAELIIAKQRNGPVGDIPLMFMKDYTRFENVTLTRPPDEE